MIEAPRSRHSCIVAIALGLMCLAGCKSLQTDAYQSDLQTESGEPAYITVQHCLISFNEVPDVNASRSRQEAEQLAQELFEQAKAGENFDRIVARYTDDSAPGIYRMANVGFKSDMSSVIPSKKIYARDAMVPAFGDVGFPLEVGQVGMAVFDQRDSPFGWHIIKRLK
ncbi:MAG: peptidyl-prolyl cis-trans isomerase [bacterium]|nr:peptidyl-prolyl cis-trans isomerase [bacterium]